MARRKKRNYSLNKRYNRIQKFIQKYGYDPTKSYRPKKTVGRPKTTGFDKSIIKSANERLRKLEKVYKTKKDKDSDGVTYAELSNEYSLVKKYATEYPNSKKGMIYKFVDKNGRKTKDMSKAVGVRFISKTEYDAILKSISDKEKRDEFERYFTQTLENFMNAKTSTAGGIKEKIDKSYETFMSHYGQKYQNMSQNTYLNFFKTYRDMVKADRSGHFGYDDLSEALAWIDIDQAMSENQMDTVLQYINTNQWKNIPRRFFLHN